MDDNRIITIYFPSREYRNFMRNLFPVVGFILLVGIITASGCTGMIPSGSATPTVTPSPSINTPVATTAVAIKTTTVSSGRTIIDERINMLSGYPTTYQKYAFEDYGYQYLYPGDTFKVSINSNKPVNIIVVNKDDEIKFPSVIPEWNTILKQNQWDYSPTVPVFAQSDVLKKDMTFTIKDKRSYFLIIDPRFSSEKTWQGSKHEEVLVDVKVTKI